METIAIIDTSLCTNNLGDEVIMDAVNDIVLELFPSSYILRVPSHESLSDRTRAFIRQASYCFIGGTNLLSSHITPDGLWRLRDREAKILGESNTCCLGVGWNDYTETPRSRTTRILRTGLSSELVHSVRDSYTRDHLAKLGIKATTTSCPTTWSLTPDLCTKLPTAKARHVVFTLTAWRPNVEADRAFVDLLRTRYDQLYFFPQMLDDWQYFRSFGWDDVRLVSPTTVGYTDFLRNEEVDFVGTRLHGGIRAMQMGRRTLILAIDNRATELSKDIHLPVVERNNTVEIANWIEGDARTDIRLPTKAIEAWKAQFKEDTRSAPKHQSTDRARVPWMDTAKSFGRTLLHYNGGASFLNFPSTGISVISP